MNCGIMITGAAAIALSVGFAGAAPAQPAANANISFGAS